MRKVVALEKVKKLRVAAAALNKWEGDLLRLQKDFDVKVKDGMRIAILLEMMPRVHHGSLVPTCEAKTSLSLKSRST